MKDQAFSGSSEFNYCRAFFFFSQIKKKAFKKIFQLSIILYSMMHSIITLYRFKKKTLTCKNLIQNKSNPNISKLIL